MTRRLLVAQPFDLALTLEMGQTFRWRRVGDEDASERPWGDPPERWRTGQGWYSGVLGSYLVHIRQRDGGLEHRVGGPGGELHDVDLSGTLHDYFRLDDDVEAIHDVLRRDRVVGDAVERYAGLRLLRQEPWECLVSFACSRRRRIRSTRNDVEAIAKFGGVTVRLDDDCRAVFPDAESLASRESALGALPLGMGKRTILALTRRLASEPRSLDQLAGTSASTEDAVRHLEGYWGVGPKIANCVALMSLDKLDAFPVDVWVRRALAKCDLAGMQSDLEEKVKGTRTLTSSQQHRIAEWARTRFGPYAGYAGQYLFHWVEPRK